jgi:hypothetical protein
MADFDSRLPVRALATDVTVEVADSAGATINPAKEDGNLLAIKTQTDKLTFAATRLLIDGSGVTQPVSGTFWQATQPISAASLPLPTGAATEATLAALDAKVTTTANGIKVDGSAVTQPISAASLPLPTGAATEATLSAISAKLPSTLGQKTMANSFAVVLASDQSAIPVTFSPTSTVEVIDFKKATAVAANASDTHTYTPGATVKLDQVEASASGQIKIEVKVGVTGSEVSKWVAFTSKGDLKASLKLPNPITVTTADSVLVIITNTDNQAQDVYSSILVH